MVVEREIVVEVEVERERIVEKLVEKEADARTEAAKIEQDKFRDAPEALLAVAADPAVLNASPGPGMAPDHSIFVFSVQVRIIDGSCIFFAGI